MPLADRRSFHRLARAIPGQFNEIAWLALRVAEAEDLAEGHLPQRETDLGLTGEFVVGRLGIIDQPVQFRLAAAGHRLVTGDGEVATELDEGRVLALDRKAEQVDIKSLHRLDVRDILQRESELRLARHRVSLLSLYSAMLGVLIQPLEAVYCRVATALCRDLLE